MDFFCWFCSTFVKFVFFGLLVLFNFFCVLAYFSVSFSWIIHPSIIGVAYPHESRGCAGASASLLRRGSFSNIFWGCVFIKLVDNFSFLQNWTRYNQTNYTIFHVNCFFFPLMICFGLMCSYCLWPLDNTSKKICLAFFCFWFLVFLLFFKQLFYPFCFFSSDVFWCIYCTIIHLDFFFFDCVSSFLRRSPAFSSQKPTLSLRRVHPLRKSRGPGS